MQSSHDEAARVRYVTKLAGMRAQLIPKILNTHDVDAKGAYLDQADAIDQELRKHWQRPLPGPSTLGFCNSGVVAF